MDIYIFAEPIKVLLRTVFRKVPLIVMTILTVAFSVSIAMIGSKFVVRKVKFLSQLFLGIPAYPKKKQSPNKLTYQ